VDGEENGRNIMITFFHRLLFPFAHCVFYYHPSALCHEQALPKIVEN
jgi:hypothetical protein